MQEHMDKAIFSNISFVENDGIQGFTILNDADTFSSAEGSVWIGVPDDWNEQDDQFDGRDFLEDSSLFRINVDAAPYALDALCRILGIVPDGLTASELVKELRKCVPTDENMMLAIKAVDLMIRTEA